MVDALPRPQAEIIRLGLNTARDPAKAALFALSTLLGSQKRWSPDLFESIAGIVNTSNKYLGWPNVGDSGERGPADLSYWRIVAPPLGVAHDGEDDVVEAQHRKVELLPGEAIVRLRIEEDESYTLELSIDSPPVSRRITYDFGHEGQQALYFYHHPEELDL